MYENNPTHHRLLRKNTVHNTNMLSELRTLASQPGDIPPDVATRLTLSAIADVYQKLDEHLNSDINRNVTMDDMKRDIDTLKHDVGEMKSSITKNPLVSFGNHLGRNPKLIWIYTGAVFILMNLWFVDGFRRIVLLAFGFDPAIVDLFAP